MFGVKPNNTERSFACHQPGVLPCRFLYTGGEYPYPRKVTLVNRSSEPQPTLYDEATRRELHERLGKVEGQLRGVGRMLDGQRPAAEVLQQLASIRSAVKGITKGVVRAYLERCAAAAVRDGDAEAVEEMLDTLIKFVKE